MQHEKIGPRSRSLSDRGEWSQPGCFGEREPGAPVETKGNAMAAMKPRTGDGPLEVTKEGRGLVMRVPLEGGGRLVVELSAEEAKDLGAALQEATG
ncbi:hypothetical protein GCM10027521_19790 [Amycolatopsis cihanbeyliensis]